jgi:hypothetical protein
MIRPLTITFALVLGLTVTSISAHALPVNQGLEATGIPEVILVREGCGAGFQWNEKQRRCTRDTPNAQARDVRRDIHKSLNRECGPGLRFDMQLARCVRK